MSRQPYRVGLIAAGPVMQAIHLPTIQRMADKFRVTCVMDTNEAVGRNVAARAGAAFSTDAQAVIEDPDVDIVVIGSPNRFHADQVVASCEAGKKAVLCEKPLVVNEGEADRVAQVCRDTGVPVIVGTMHLFDPAWVRALAQWRTHRCTPHTVRIRAFIPANPRSEDFATEIVGRPVGNLTALPGHSSEADAARIHGGVLGLAVHDLPVARRLLPDLPVRVVAAHTLSMGGYEIVATVGESILEIQGMTGAPWEPQWVLEAQSPEAALTADFSLSYVHAGSARLRVSTKDSTVEYRDDARDGYLEEWDHVHRVVTGQEAAPDIDVAVDDARFVADIADQASSVIRNREAA